MRVFSSLPQELEDEALRAWDSCGDQVALTSKHILDTTTEERQTTYSIVWSGLFYFVFGYAQAKGWTSAEKRMNPKL